MRSLIRYDGYIGSYEMTLLIPTNLLQLHTTCFFIGHIRRHTGAEHYQFALVETLTQTLYCHQYHAFYDYLLYIYISQISVKMVVQRNVYVWRDACGVMWCMHSSNWNYLFGRVGGLWKEPWECDSGYMHQAASWSISTSNPRRFRCTPSTKCSSLMFLTCSTSWS